MDINLIVRYTAAGAILASLLYLVVIGKVSAGQYETLAVGALSALGGYHAGRFQGGEK